jgi:protein TonB
MIDSSDERSLLRSSLAAAAAHILVAAFIVCAAAYGLDRASDVSMVYLVGDGRDRAIRAPAASGETLHKKTPVLPEASVSADVRSGTETTAARYEKKAESMAAVSAGTAGTVSDQTSVRGTDGGKSRIDTFTFGAASGPDFLRRAIPVYPNIARRLHKEGRVLLRLAIDERGRLMNVEVVERAGFGFTDAALDAVRRSTYSPAVKNGEPSASLALLPVRFRLAD